MTGEKDNQLVDGVYHLFLMDGSSRLAVVGTNSAGYKWFYSTDPGYGGSGTSWHDVANAVLIESEDGSKPEYKPGDLYSKVISKLHKTADGVTIFPGDSIWFFERPAGSDNYCPYERFVHTTKEFCVAINANNEISTKALREGYYSTELAARAAIQNKLQEGIAEQNKKMEEIMDKEEGS